MKALSLTATYQYRKHVIRNKDIDLDILKIKINCLINASYHKTIVFGGTQYRFGSCKIKVNENNIVTSITWDKEKINPSYKEIKRLKQLYKQNNLNENGTEYLTT